MRFTGHEDALQKAACIWKKSKVAWWWAATWPAQLSAELSSSYSRQEHVFALTWSCCPLVPSSVVSTVKTFLGEPSQILFFFLVVPLVPLSMHKSAAQRRCGHDKIRVSSEIPWALFRNFITGCTSPPTGNCGVEISRQTWKGNRKRRIAGALTKIRPC